MSIAPGSWTMMAGTAATFAVTVVGIPDGCSLVTSAPGWSLPGYAALAGFLNQSGGSSITYTAFASAGGGPVQISVAGPLVLVCGGTDRSAWASGSASLAILPTAHLAGPFITPDPAAPGDPVLVSWRLTGGLPPYAVQVDFGDGTRVAMTQEGAGPAEVVHRFNAGMFQPGLSIQDSRGDGVNDSAAIPLTVSYGLTASIVGPGPVVDAGRPFTLTANATGGLAPYEFRWEGVGAPFHTTTWTAVVQAPGTFNATLEVIDLLGTTAEASVELHVVLPPSLNVTVPSGGSDAGVPFPVRFNVSGGTGPYELAWGTGPASSNSSATVSSDGSYLEPASVPSPGAAWLSVTVLDALGANRTAAVPLGPVHPLPMTSVSVTPTTAEPGELLRLTAVVTAGTPPFRWSVLPSGPVASPSTVSGTLLADGTVAWSSTIAATGNLSVLVTIVDSNGAVASANGSVRVVPGLRLVVAVASPNPSLGNPLVLSGLLTGGTPPYLYRWSLSDGETSVGNLSNPGPVTFSATPRGAGYLAAVLWVTDFLGGEANSSTEVLVPTTGSGTTAVPSPSTASAAAESGWAWPVGAVAIIVAGAVFWALRLRRPAGGPTPAAPPGGAGMGVVRRLLQESGELERETLTFLAEEEGVSPEATLAAVDRWSRAGKIRSEMAGEGETLLRWAGGSTEGVGADAGGPP
jgi:hypothetical protein